MARIARAGFPSRYMHAQFAERYSILLPPRKQGEVAHSSSALVVGWGGTQHQLDYQNNAYRVPYLQSFRCM